jgi:SAM-dependent methyltransferase
MPSGLIQGDLWGDRAEDWANLGEPTTAPLWLSVLGGCGVYSGSTLLDIGCGAGGLAQYARERGAKVTGLDASESLIAIARQRMPDAEFYVGDIEDLPFEDDSFEFVTACNCIQFADDQVKAAVEAKRVLSPGGRFGIGMWCEPERCEVGVVFQEVGKIAPPMPAENAPPSLSNVENLYALLERAGFVVVDGGEVECPFVFSDAEECWRAMRSAGIMAGLARVIGDEPLRKAVMDAIPPFTRPDGSIRISNWFRFAVCE